MATQTSVIVLVTALILIIAGIGGYYVWTNEKDRKAKAKEESEAKAKQKLADDAKLRACRKAVDIRFGITGTCGDGYEKITSASGRSMCVKYSNNKDDAVITGLSTSNDVAPELIHKNLKYTAEIMSSGQGYNEPIKMIAGSCTKGDYIGDVPVSIFRLQAQAPYVYQDAPIRLCGAKAKEANGYQDLKITTEGNLGTSMANKCEKEFGEDYTRLTTIYNDLTVANLKNINDLKSIEKPDSLPISFICGKPSKCD